MSHVIRLSALLISLVSIAAATAGTVVIDVDASKAGPRVNPRLYGIFLEEINHGVDGGLYPEMIRNRGFEDAKPPDGYTNSNGRWMAGTENATRWGRFGYFTSDLPFWSLVKDGAAQGSMNLDMTNSLDAATPRSLRLEVEDVGSGRIGIANSGFWGMGVTAGAKYDLSFWARGEDFSGTLTAVVENASGEAVGKAVTIKGVTPGWKQFKATLTATQTEPRARFVLTAGAKGKIWFDMVSLFPAATFKGRANGLRPDLAQFLADLKPGFVRFPGGCVIEGATVESAYNWKDSVGPLEKRTEQWGPWSYRETHGMGLFEYMQFCEDIGALPLYVGFCGETCHFRNVQDVPMDQMGWVATNFLDVIEYANGGKQTPWGKVRAAAGHPKPFNLKLIEVGNEEQARTFPPRYTYVHSILKAQHPELSYINDYSFINRNQMGNEPADIEDNHYYESPQWFMNNTHLYDNRSRKLPPVYDGEVAVTSGDAGDTKGNLLAALAEGAFLMGLERNADAVNMVSYAPLLANVRGRTTWHGMIYFDTLHSYATASYYLWKMFGLNRPDYTVAADVNYTSDAPKFISGGIGVGTWNTSAEFKDVKVEKDGQALYVSDFTNGATGWKTDGGNWTVVNGAYHQGNNVQGLSYFGDEGWANYTLTLKARKLSGAEGFLIVFGKKGGDKYWWNVGGWGNAQHGLEFNGSPISQVRGRVTTDHWYDVKVVVRDRHVQCFLDNELIQEAEAPTGDRFFANAGRDEARGELVIKAINFSPTATAAKVHLAGLSKYRTEADVAVLTSAALSDNNTMSEPKKIVPVNSKATVAGDSVNYDFPANSLTVIRLKAK